MSTVNFAAWKNVNWSQVDTDGSGCIDGNEVTDAQDGYGITLWNKMDERAFKYEKALHIYIAESLNEGETCIGDSRTNPDLEKEIFALGNNITKLKKKIGQTKNPNEKMEYERQIEENKKLIKSHATRIFGPLREKHEERKPNKPLFARIEAWLKTCGITFVKTEENSSRYPEKLLTYNQ